MFEKTTRTQQHVNRDQLGGAKIELPTEPELSSLLIQAGHPDGATPN